MSVRVVRAAIELNDFYECDDLFKACWLRVFLLMGVVCLGEGEGGRSFGMVPVSDSHSSESTVTSVETDE